VVLTSVVEAVILPQEDVTIGVLHNFSPTTMEALDPFVRSISNLVTLLPLVGTDLNKICSPTLVLPPKLMLLLQLLQLINPDIGATNHMTADLANLNLSTADYIGQE
jgi:hypothetical protein